MEFVVEGEVVLVVVLLVVVFVAFLLVVFNPALFVDAAVLSAASVGCSKPDNRRTNDSDANKCQKHRRRYWGSELASESVRITIFCHNKCADLLQVCRRALQ